MSNAVMKSPVLASPLADVAGLGQRVLRVDGRTCMLSEIPFEQMINLRGTASDPAFAQAVLAGTNLVLPTAVNSVSLNAQRQLLCLGPDEWLLKTQDGQGDALEAALTERLAGQHVSVVQVGDGSTTFALQGPASADLLARGCPLDLHARSFGAGAVAQSHVAKASVTLLCLAPGQHYELTLRRSFAVYLYQWLCAAGA